MKGKRVHEPLLLLLSQETVNKFVVVALISQGGILVNK